jgi:hypothetical protein
MTSRRRTMTDGEIALAKAMLKRGMKNDVIHYFFNQSDRLISPGRITQIKQKKYGTAVEEASQSELEAFLHAREVQRDGRAAGMEEPVARARLLSMFRKDASEWTLVTGETDYTECKLSFRLASNKSS